jgi:hypothetical protein
MAKFVVKKGQQNDMCHNEIELCAQNLDSIVGSILNTIGRTHVDHLKRQIWIVCIFYNQS